MPNGSELPPSEKSSAEKEEDRHIEGVRKLNIKSEKDGLMWLTSRLSENLDKAQEQAVIDSLTGLLNRRGFGRATEGMFAPPHANENEQRKNPPKRYKSFSVLELDIDRFKSINDTYGHDAGDAILRAVAQSVKNRLREGDLISRWGGEEFVVLFPNTTAADIGRRFGARPVDVEVEVPQSDGSKKKVALSVTLSGGIKEFKPGDDFDAAYKAADEALYLSKKDGRNRITIAGD